MKSCLYFSLVSSVFVCGFAHATCTPSPDCASLGYTATSCPNGGVKCPFDTSKWHCNECGADYKYTCSGTGYVSGAGTSCNSKFTSCICSSGYAWQSDSCKKISGECCNDGSINGCSYSEDSHSYCQSTYGYDDCRIMRAACISLGGKSSLLKCGNGVPGFGSYVRATLGCDY